MMSYHVRTSVFEGPLDLLLQLITRHQVDITELSLVDLVSEYLSFLDEMREMDLEVTSEFLLIAATLVQLKARHLLPDDAEVDIDEELALMEERDRLLSRLLACVTFKDVAVVISHRLRDRNRHVGRFVGVQHDPGEKPPEVIVPVDRDGLAEIAARALTRRHEPDLDHLDLDLPSVERAIEDVRIRVEQLAETTFEDLVEHCTRKVEVVAYFLAVLELARWGLVTVAQPDWAAKITVEHRDGAMPQASEWGAA